MKPLIPSHTPERPVHRQNAVILFTRTPQITRTNPDEPYAALPWEDLDALFTAILGDLVEQICRVSDIDILLYRNPLEFSEEFLQPYRDSIHCCDMPAEGPVTAHVQGAIDQALRLHYGRVVALLENQPLIGAALISKVFSQLSCEDDAIVIGPTPEGRVYLLGVKSSHTALFVSEGADLFAKPFQALYGACQENALVFPAPSRYFLDTGTNLARLRLDVDAMAESAPGFPRRTSAMFKLFDKKYRLRKPNR